jgi:hypothetical protein
MSLIGKSSLILAESAALCQSHNFSQASGGLEVARKGERGQSLLGTRPLHLCLNRVELPDALDDLACLRIEGLRFDAPFFISRHQVSSTAITSP